MELFVSKVQTHKNYYFEETQITFECPALKNKKLAKKVLYVGLEACIAQGVFSNPLCVWFALVYVIEYLGT